MRTVIETSKLTKSYGKSRGIIDVDLSVNEGEIFGFIGPNGAGKSTTIRTLLNLIHKSSGEAHIFGYDCEKQSDLILQHVGYLPSEVFYYEKMKAKDLLKYSASFYKKDCSKRIAELADRLELNLNQRIDAMSLGNRKKVGIIQGLLHQPSLIILDEPTSGLDPLMQRTFFDIIKEENKKGATVLFSSHILSEVQQICDRVAIIKEGRIINTQKISELVETNYKRVQLVFRTEALANQFMIKEATQVEVDGKKMNFLYRGYVQDLLKLIAYADILDVNIENPSLEEIFMHYYTPEEA